MVAMRETFTPTKVSDDPMAHGDFHSFTTRAEYIVTARRLWQTARTARKGGYASMADDFERRARRLLATARGVK